MLRLLVCLLGSYLSVGWAGGFGIETTRVIYHQQDKAVQVAMHNTTQGSTYLVKVRIVDAQGEPVEGFQVIPPLVRIDAGGNGNVRVLFHPLKPLPADRESLFYFSALAISSSNPLAKEGGGGFSGRMNMVLGNRIKFFYRPTGVDDPSKNTFEKLTFSRVPSGIRVKNPTPYNVSFTSIKVDGVDVSLSQGGGAVLSPFSEQIYLVNSSKKKNVRWSVINDLGGGDSYTGVIQ